MPRRYLANQLCQTSVAAVDQHGYIASGWKAEQKRLCLRRGSALTALCETPLDS